MQGKSSIWSAAIIAVGTLAGGSAQAQDYKLVEPGKLTIATTAEMPGIVPKDGGLVDTTGKFSRSSPKGSDLKVNPVKMEWSGVIASVQAGRMDVLGGNVGWTPERTKILALTDPTQYFGNGITHKADQPMSTLADLENKRRGDHHRLLIHSRTREDSWHPAVVLRYVGRGAA